MSRYDRDSPPIKRAPLKDSKSAFDITWPNESLLSRLDRCRRMLTIHGIITDGESDRAKRRIDKLYEG